MGSELERRMWAGEEDVGCSHSIRGNTSLGR